MFGRLRELLYLFLISDHFLHTSGTCDQQRGSFVKRFESRRNRLILRSDTEHDQRKNCNPIQWETQCPRICEKSATECKPGWALTDLKHNLENEVRHECCELGASNETACFTKEIDMSKFRTLILKSHSNTSQRVFRSLKLNIKQASQLTVKYCNIDESSEFICKNQRRERKETQEKNKNEDKDGNRDQDINERNSENERGREDTNRNGEQRNNGDESKTDTNNNNNKNQNNNNKNDNQQNDLSNNKQNTEGNQQPELVNRQQLGDTQQQVNGQQPEAQLSDRAQFNGQQPKADLVDRPQFTNGNDKLPLNQRLVQNTDILAKQPKAEIPRPINELPVLPKTGDVVPPPGNAVAYEAIFWAKEALLCTVGCTAIGSVALALGVFHLTCDTTQVVQYDSFNVTHVVHTGTTVPIGSPASITCISPYHHGSSKPQTITCLGTTIWVPQATSVLSFCDRVCFDGFIGNATRTYTGHTEAVGDGRTAVFLGSSAVTSCYPYGNSGKVLHDGTDYFDSDQTSVCQTQNSFDVNYFEHNCLSVCANLEMSGNATAGAFTRTFTDTNGDELVLEGSSVATKCDEYTGTAYYDGAEYHLADQSSTCLTSGSWDRTWNDDSCIYYCEQRTHDGNASKTAVSPSPTMTSSGELINLYGSSITTKCLDGYGAGAKAITDGTSYWLSDRVTVCGNATWSRDHTSDDCVNVCANETTTGNATFDISSVSVVTSVESTVLVLEGSTATSTCSSFDTQVLFDSTNYYETTRTGTCTNSNWDVSWWEHDCLYACQNKTVSGNATIEYLDTSITTTDNNVRWLENNMINTSCSTYGPGASALADNTGSYFLRDIEYTCSNGQWSDDYSDDACLLACENKTISGNATISFTGTSITTTDNNIVLWPESTTVKSECSAYGSGEYVLDDKEGNYYVNERVATCSADTGQWDFDYSDDDCLAVCANRTQQENAITDTSAVNLVTINDASGQQFALTGSTVTIACSNFSTQLLNLPGATEYYNELGTSTCVESDRDWDFRWWEFGCVFACLNKTQTGNATLVTTGTKISTTSNATFSVVDQQEDRWLVDSVVTSQCGNTELLQDGVDGTVHATDQYDKCGSDGLWNSTYEDDICVPDCDRLETACEDASVGGVYETSSDECTCYVYHETKLEWHDAWTACRADTIIDITGHLAQPDTQAALDTLKPYLVNTKSRSDLAWIGIRALSLTSYDSSSFRYPPVANTVTVSASDPSLAANSPFWASDQPSDFANQGSPCVALDVRNGVAATAGFADAVCDHGLARGYICQFSASIN